MTNRIGWVICAVACGCGAPASQPDAGSGGGIEAVGGGGGATGGGGQGTGGGDVDPDAGTADCSTFGFTDVMIPMRDGKSLSAFVHAPTDARCRLPTILIQTPYNKQSARALWFGADTEPLFSSPAYNFVVVDWRGFFGSTAARVTGQQPYGTDGYDTVEWIAAQPFSDRKVGMWGVSALCQQQYKTAATKPPHLTAAVPIFCEMNQTYDQYYPGGVLRREYFNFVATYFGAAALTSAPYHSPVWSLSEATITPQDITVPMLLVAGWYDLYPGGELHVWQQLQSSPPAAQHRLLIGEWIHFAAGGESHGGRTLTPEELQWTDTGKVIQRDSLAFFDLHLRGDSTGAAASWSAVRYSRNGTWLQSPVWPPANATGRDWFLTADGGLRVAAPTNGLVDFPYDPADPSPTIGGATLSGDLLHGPQNQAAVIARGDARTFTSAELPAAVQIGGRLAVHLEVATDRVDTDFAVRLTDVQPDGGQLLIAEGIRRLKLRGAGYAAPEAVTPGTRYPLDVPFTADLAYSFAAGHRIGLIVSSSNFPRFDRNPNTGADFVPDAGAPVLSATNTLFLDGAAKLTLPVAP